MFITTILCITKLLNKEQDKDDNKLVNVGHNNGQQPSFPNHVTRLSRGRFHTLYYQKGKIRENNSLSRTRTENEMTHAGTSETNDCSRFFNFLFLSLSFVSVLMMIDERSILPLDGGVEQN